MKDHANKNIYVILGFLRCGTSVIARSLKTLSIDLGEKLKPPNDNWNPTGFFEDEEIVYDIHQKLHATLNEPKRSILFIDKNAYKNPAFDDIKNSSIALLNDRFKERSHFAFKDPGVAKILPFWQSIFETLRLKDHYIIAVRNPLSSASSFSRLSGLDLELSVLLWLIHMLSAVSETYHRNTIFVSYDLMMQNPQHEILRIKNHFNLSVNPQEIDIFVKGFLNERIQHNRYTDEDLVLHPTILAFPLCLKAYQLFMKLARDEIFLKDLEFTNSWQDIQTELNHIYPLYVYLDKLLKKQKELKGEIRNIKESLIWKVTSPFYKINYMLQKKRRLKKAKKKIYCLRIKFCHASML